MRGRLERQQNLVLAEEAGEGEDAGERQPADGKGQVGDRQPVPQASEPAHVDDVAHRVHHAAGGQEEQGLEERVREQVEHRGHHGKLRHIAHARPQAHEHIAKLADRRVRHDPLEVILRQGDRGRQQRRGAANDRDQHLDTRARR